MSETTARSRKDLQLPLSAWLQGLIHRGVVREASPGSETFYLDEQDYRRFLWSRRILILGAMAMPLLVAALVIWSLNSGG